MLRQLTEGDIVYHSEKEQFAKIKMINRNAFFEIIKELNNTQPHLKVPSNEIVIKASGPDNTRINFTPYDIQLLSVVSEQALKRPEYVTRKFAEKEIENKEALPSDSYPYLDGIRYVDLEYSIRSKRVFSNFDY